MGGLLRDQVREVIFSAVLGRGATPTSLAARLASSEPFRGRQGAQTYLGPSEIRGAL